MVVKLSIAVLLTLAPVGALAADSSKMPAPATDVQGGGTLSDKLSTSNGVIHPKENADPAIEKAPPPNAEAPMPVIPPPGTPGGEQNVKPK